MVQFVELFLGNIQESLFEAFLGESGTTRSMFAILAIIFALAVVKERKQAHHRHIGTRYRGNQKSIEFHLPPMSKAVDI